MPGVSKLDMGLFLLSLFVSVFFCFPLFFFSEWISSSLFGDCILLLFDFYVYGGRWTLR